jgi:acetyl-CoA/propionyl-CoA carboxylase biotin carboxyl carrier protein
MSPLPGATPIVFIANRGEIAVRVIRTAIDLGYRTAVIYVDDDADAPYVGMADDARRVERGEGNPFLDVGTIVASAVASGAGFVHPGYGFLSENAELARAVSAAGMIWVGPDAAAIEALGDKVSARAIAHAVGAPLTAGIDRPVTDLAEISAFAARVGYPVAVKAAHGGGGRGMRIIRSSDEIERQFESARSEAASAFGRDECFVEQYLDRPRHVETQCLADAHGNVSVISTRDCSLQRRHQKLLEEAPAPGLSAGQLQVMTTASRDILRHVGYVGAATCEFLISRDGAISFLEVNTRIQVEHTVTEVVSGIDLIEQQFRIARGEAVAFAADHAVTGVALEFRINSEDPTNGFFPSTGVVGPYIEPGGPWVRVDSGICDGATVSGSFDSMLAKLIVFGSTREQAIARSRRALAEYRIGGIRTVVPFFRAVLEDPTFLAHGCGGEGIYTGWLEKEFLAGTGLAAVHGYTPESGTTPVSAPPGVEPGMREFRVVVDGRAVTLGLPPELLSRDTRRLPEAPRLNGVNARTATATAAEGLAVMAPAHATVLATHVTEGDAVVEGDPLATIEVMKMEHLVVAPRAGRAMDLAHVGDTVSPTKCLLRLV